MPRDINLNMYFNMNQRSVQKSVGTFAKFEKTLATLGYRAARTSALLDRHIVDPLKRIAQAAVDSSATLYRSLGEVQTLLVGSLTETTARMESFKSDMRVLSIEVVKDMNDLTKGLYEYISAFQELPNTMEGFTIAAKVARAGITSTKQAVDLLSSVSLAYGDTSTATQQKIADLSFETVRLAKTHIPELAANVSKVAPIFAIMGLEMEQLFGVASTLIGITGDTTEVFTQMRRVVLSMQKPNQTMVKLLNALGYSGAFAGKELLKDDGLVGAIKQLNTQAGEMGISIEKAVGRIQGIMPVLAFQLQSVQDRYESVMLSINKPGGATESALEKAIDGIATNATRLDRAKLALENIGRKLGDRLLPLLSRFYDLIVAMLEKLLSKQSFPTLERLLAQIGWLTTAIGDLSEGWTRFLTNVVVGSVVVSPALGMFAVLLFSIETSITLARGAWVLLAGTVKGVIKLLKVHNGLMNNLRFQLGRITFQMRELRLGWKIATAEGLKGIKRIKAAIALGGFKGTLLAIVPWVALIAVIAAAIFVLVKLNKHFRNKAIEFYSENAVTAAASFDELKSSIVNYADALTDLYSITDVFEQKLGFMELLVKKQAEALSIEAEMKALQSSLKEYQAGLDSYKPNFPFLRDMLEDVTFAITGMKFQEPAWVVAYKDSIELLKQKVIQAETEIWALEDQANELKFGILPEIEAKALKKSIDDMLGDFTYSSGAFEIDVVLGVADLNRVNDLLGMEINPLAESMKKVSDSIIDVKFKAAEAEEELQRLNLTLSFAEGADDSQSKIRVQAINLKIEAINIYKKAIEATLVELRKYFEVGELLSEQTASFANAFLQATQEMNKYAGAIEDNITIQEALNDVTIPADVKERLRFMLDANNELINAYVDQLWLLKAKASIPAEMAQLKSVSDLVMKIKESNRQVKQFADGLVYYQALLEKMTSVPLNADSNKKVEELLQIIAELKKQLGLDVEIKTPELSNIERGFASMQIGLADYNEALDALADDTKTWSLLELDYLNNIKKGYEDKVKALKDVERIMAKLPRQYKGIVSFESAWLKYNKSVEEIAGWTHDLFVAQEKLDIALAAGDVEAVNFLSNMIDGLSEALGITIELAEEIEDISKTNLFDSQILSIDITDATGQISFALSDFAKEAGAYILESLAGINNKIGALLGPQTEGPDGEMQDYDGGALQGIVDAVKLNAQFLGKVIGDTFVKVKDGIRTWMTEKMPDVQAGISNFFWDVGEAFRQTGEKITEVFDWAVGGVQAIVDSGFGKVVGKIAEAAGAYMGGMFDMLGGLASMGMDIFLPILLETPEIQAVLEGLMSTFTALAGILGPAIGNILEPLVEFLGEIAVMFGLMLLPVLEALMPVFNMIAIILEAALVPILQMLAPSLAFFAGAIEFLMPVIGLLAKAIIVLLSPFQFLGTILNWAADTMRTAFHNLKELFDHPFSERNRDNWKFPKLDEALASTAAKIQSQLDAVDASMESGIGNEGDVETGSGSYYTDLGNTPLEDITNPLAGDEGGSGGGSGANIKQMTQHNYITVNTGALVGSDAFDEFVMIVTRRLNELKEVV